MKHRGSNGLAKILKEKFHLSVTVPRRRLMNNPEEMLNNTLHIAARGDSENTAPTVQRWSSRWSRSGKRTWCLKHMQCERPGVRCVHKGPNGENWEGAGSEASRKKEIVSQVWKEKRGMGWQSLCTQPSCQSTNAPYPRRFPRQGVARECVHSSSRTPALRAGKARDKPASITTWLWQVAKEMHQYSRRWPIPRKEKENFVIMSRLQRQLQPFQCNYFF